MMLCSIKLAARSVVFFASVLTVISISRKIAESFHHTTTIAPFSQFDDKVEFLESENIPDSNGLDNELEELEEEDEDEWMKDEWNLDEGNVPGLPLILRTSKKGPKHHNASCAKFPDLYTIQFSNIHWQVQQTKFETYFLYGAYLDVRGMKNASDLKRSKVSVRILGMSNNLSSVTSKSKPMTKICQFWFEGKTKPKFGNVLSTKLLWYAAWGDKAHYFPIIVTCQFPKYLKEIPASVSLVAKLCDNATNNLNILHRGQLAKGGHAPKKNFGVCVKALDFPDEHMYTASRLVEWIETIRLLGAEKIFFYEFYVNSTIKKILDHYESIGLIHVMPTTLPGELPNQPQLRHLYIKGKRTEKRLTELIPYNDCLLRHMYDFKYLAVIDVDELIMPKTVENWTKLLEEVTVKEIMPNKTRSNLTIATFCFQNVYFVTNMSTANVTEISDIPEDFFMLQHIYRARNYTAHKQMKCFHKTSVTLGVHNHYAFHCLTKRCHQHYVDFKRAQMSHYKATCVTKRKNCTAHLRDRVKDTTIWRYRDAIMERASEVMKITE